MTQTADPIPQQQSPMTKADKLRALLARPEMIVLPGVPTPEAAAIAEAVGFEAVHVHGGGVMARYFMFNDWGMMYPNEMVEITGRFAAATSLPTICDADQGGETPLNTYRMVKDLIKADVAGAHFEDTLNPKHLTMGQGTGMGTNEYSRIVSIEEMTVRLQAAVDARKGTGRDFIIIARTDAIENRLRLDENSPERKEALEECIRRGNAYAEAGADMLLPDLASWNEHQAIIRSVPIPIMAHSSTKVVDSRKLTAADWRETGAKIWLFVPTAHVFTGFFEAALQYALDTGDESFEQFKLSEGFPRPIKYKRFNIDEEDYFRIGKAWVAARDKSSNYRW